MLLLLLRRRTCDFGLRTAGHGRTHAGVAAVPALWSARYGDVLPGMVGRGGELMPRAHPVGCWGLACIDRCCSDTVVRVRPLHAGLPRWPPVHRSSFLRLVCWQQAER